MSDATVSLLRAAEPAPQRAPAREKKRPELRVVPPRVRRRRAGLAVSGTCLAVFGLLFGLTAFQALIARNQMDLDRTEQRLADAVEYQDKLRLQVARMESPDNVIARATGELGMQDPDQIVYVTPSIQDAHAVGASAAGTPPMAPSATPVVIPPADPSQLPG